jgi:hypothetical protein
MIGFIIFMVGRIAVIHADNNSGTLQVEGNQIASRGHGISLCVNYFYGEMRHIASVPLALPVSCQVFLPKVYLPIQFDNPLPLFQTQQSILPSALDKPVARNFSPFCQCTPTDS